VGGDFYDFHEVSDKKIGVLIGDVSGHGIPAALISSMFKMAFMVYRDNPEPASVLGRISALLQGYLKRQFVTASYMMIDLARMKMVSANAGHWPQLLWRGERGGGMVDVYTKGRAMGVMREQSFRQREYDIQSGDRILMFTDGLVECMDPDGRLFGEERLRACIMNSGGLAAPALCEKLLSMAESWSGIAPGEGFEDDVCVVCVDIL
jgi:serine phosphatase RsbU (regulator of sigma subunit)